jgi:hypothetical protein
VAVNFRAVVVLGAALAALSTTDVVRAADPAPAPPRLPFSDDVAAPPPLPQPIDRAFKAELVEFDGDRVSLRWSWKSAAELDDFESFVPVRSTLSGGFVVKDGRVSAAGTAGIRLKLGMLSDLEVHVGPSTLKVPHDLGIVLAAPGSSDESILCLVQDVLFTKFDRAAGNTNMINKLGGITSATAGMTEFRYVARSLEPRLAPNADVSFDVVRKGQETTFVVTPKSGGAVTLKGKDPDPPMSRFTPGLYVAGGVADFGALAIAGRIDAQWCADHGVLPFFAGDLLHPGNKWKPPERKLAEMVERYAHQDAANAGDPKKAVSADAVAPLVGDVKVPLVIRIRAAEALMDQGDAGAVAETLATLLDSKDQPGRILAWQVLRPRLPWHFRYEVDAEPKQRRDSAQLIAAYLRERDDEEAQGKEFVEGAWYTPERADDVRSNWEHAWEMRTPHVRLRTDLPKKWADWYRKALECEYRELVRLVGREPPTASLPLSVLVFKDAADFAAFCNANGYAAKASWGRFVDMDKNVSFTTFDKKDGLANTMGQVAKQFHRVATGKFWPVWFDEGRASWFGNPDYGTVGFDGTTLSVGIVGHGDSVKLLAKAAAEEKMPAIIDVVAKNPRDLTGEPRRIWYVEAWAVHAWLVGFAPEPIRAKFAQWQSVMEKLPTTPRDVDDQGLREFLAFFTKDLPDMDRAFGEWVKGL